MKNVVFDVGAVLLSWEPVSLVHAVVAPHTPTAQAAHALACEMFHHEDWLGFDRGTHSLEDAIGRMALRLSLPVERLNTTLAPVGERLEPIDVTIELLGALRARRDAGEALRLYYLSNMPAPYARVLEQRHEFFRWFDGGIFSGDVRMIKPQREIFQLLASRYALEASQTLFIDDSAANVAAARALGWEAIHCEAPSELPAQLATYLPVRSILSTSKPSERA
ncbi:MULTISPECIES: HAD-IA family hydrolase [unclassified Variovorax]|uniref:HAD-IA family hydrolase n=1 Tax=unclassified Variovorax TaxID=663243 RepID=UPI00076BFB29|nr:MULTISPECIES: HAD-IA family hydrolase [unclassified Variovorax]KWT97373.1 HAD superfamily hydrolase [Variovorax sp. WDL1]PNG60044.1 Phosphoglycolate phosphatase [Variovorax sp. B4]PNG60163.1 Phosphoglycolate phosphatase [Variovorax sp. B2]VTV14016.1 ?-D-glucose-1-phosphatase [Variovorax sp. WDL1]